MPERKSKIVIKRIVALLNALPTATICQLLIKNLENKAQKKTTPNNGYS